jgi:hypothetical protein
MCVPRHAAPYLLAGSSHCTQFSLRDAASTAQANFMNIFRVLSVPMVLYLSTQTIVCVPVTSSPSLC